MKTKTHTLKLRQEQILYLLYRFRFLNTHHIQTLLNHKQRNKIILWLNDLEKNNYIKKYYSQKFAGQAAIYSLGLEGKRYFKEKKTKDVQEKLLNRIYREHTLTMKFRKHCLFVADIYISLLTLTDKNKLKLKFFTKTDMSGIRYLVLPEPDIYFTLGGKDAIKRYFLDIFDDLPPRMILRKRIRQYTNYFEKEYWQNHTKQEFPEIILVCPDNTSKNYLNGFIQKTLEEKELEMIFYLSTWGEIQSQGVQKEALRKVLLGQ